MRSLLICTIAAGALLATAGHASAQDLPPMELDSTQVTADGLYKVTNSIMALAYVKPHHDLQSYSKFMLDPVSVAYQRDPHGQRSALGAGGHPNFELAPYQMDNFKEWFQDEVKKALSEDDGYELVDAPAPDVLRITTALMDLVVTVPTEQGGMATGTTRDFGDVTLLVELRDSQSGELLARVGERRTITDDDRAGFARIAPSYAEHDARDLFEYWADMMRLRLDEIRKHAAGSDK